jgi:tRNA G18 (ribose-2'-O)-methylase SpoU
VRKLTYEEIFSRREDLDSLKGKERLPVTVIAENIRSLHNVGSIFRTSDAARITELHLCGYTGTPPRNEISKTALGSDKSVSWRQFKDATEAISGLKKRKVPIVVLEHTDESRSYTDMKYDFPLCLVIGNEVEGISDAAVALADQAIEIPMHGIKHSLNVGVAYGIVMFHILNQYAQARPGKAPGRIS